jgi:hypothetical protein
MTNVTTPSIQQRNAEAWLTLKAALDECGMRYGTRTDYEGALWIDCFSLDFFPSCLPRIKIGPGVGVALVQVCGKQSVPDSYRSYAGRVLAQVSLQCTLGSIKYHVGSGVILVETPILFIGSALRPQDALYALWRMSHLLESVMDELWEVFNERKWMKKAQATLEERARNLVKFEVDECD